MFLEVRNNISTLGKSSIKQSNFKTLLYIYNRNHLSNISC